MTSNQRLQFLLIPVLCLLAAGCAPDPVRPPEPPAPRATTPVASAPRPDSEDPSLEGTFIGLTYQRLDGNRVLEGQGSIQESAPIRIALPGDITWLAAVPYSGGSLWAAVLEDGETLAVLVEGGIAQTLDLGWGDLPPGSPPFLLARDGAVELVGPITGRASPLTHPVPVGLDPLRLAYIETEGDLVLWEDGGEIGRLAVSALPDARLLVDEAGRILLLTDPTERYDHGVLGDAVEAGSISLVETDPELKVAARIEIPSPAVLEGIAPIWADLDGDGRREILVTVSDYDAGARLVLYSEAGDTLAEGPAAGQGYRWRHQLAALPLDGGPERIVVDVLRPHLDALFEVFSWRSAYLTVMETIPGYPSHAIGSRNLDQALAGDFDGDGVIEVVVPGRERDTLSGIYYAHGVMGQAWSLDLGGNLTSNLAGVVLGDGDLLLGAGVGKQLVVFGE